MTSYGHLESKLSVSLVSTVIVLFGFSCKVLVLLHCFGVLRRAGIGVWLISGGLVFF